MKKAYRQAYISVLAEVQKLDDAAEAKLEPHDEIENALLLTGQVIGNDTREQINQIVEKYGFIVLARQLLVLYRENEK